MKLASKQQSVPFECRCGNVHNTGDGKLPVGWTTRNGFTWCEDCTRAGIAVRTIRPRRAEQRQAASDKLRLRSQVLALLQEGAALMPPGSQKRVAWVDRVNALITQQKDVA